MQARAQEILREKLTGIAETYDETSREIQSTLNQMDEAFELLMPTPDKTQPGKQGTAQDEEGLEWEDVAAGDAASGTHDSSWKLLSVHHSRLCHIGRQCKD